MCTGRKRIPGRGGVTRWVQALQGSRWTVHGGAQPMAAPKTPGSILLERRRGSRKMGRGAFQFPGCSCFGGN